MNATTRFYRGTLVSALLAGGALLPVSAWSVTFQDIAAGGGLIDVPTEYRISPYKTYGAPGVAVLDFDGDGDSALQAYDDSH